LPATRCYPVAVTGIMTVAEPARTRAEIARRVRDLAQKRQREAARSSRSVKAQLNKIATNYLALADELERPTSAGADAPKITPTQEDR